MKKLFLSLFVLVSFSAFAQDPIKSVTLGFNRFPLFYYRPFFGPGLGDAPFPFHVSANIPMNEKLEWRVGANFSSGRIPFLRSSDFCVGLEGGAEYAFLKPESKWLINGSALLFVSHWATDYSFQREDLIFNAIGVGPEIMIGYKFNDQLALCSATNFQVGFFDWGPGIERNALNAFSMRSLSAELRYTF